MAYVWCVCICVGGGYTYKCTLYEYIYLHCVHIKTMFLFPCWWLQYAKITYKQTVLKKPLCVYRYMVVYGTINWLVYSQTEESSIFTYSYENEIISPILIFLVTKVVPFSRYVTKYNYKISRCDTLWNILRCVF